MTNNRVTTFTTTDKAHAEFVAEYLTNHTARHKYPNKYEVVVAYNGEYGVMNRWYNTRSGAREPHKDSPVLTDNGRNYGYTHRSFYEKMVELRSKGLVE